MTSVERHVHSEWTWDSPTHRTCARAGWVCTRCGQAVIIKAAGETHVYGDEAPLPWQTVKVVPDEPEPFNE